MKINPGTVIRWQTPTPRIINSQFCSRKEGVYMGYCPPKTKPVTVCPVLAEVTNSCKKFGNSGVSENPRLIVEVLRFHSITGEPIKSHWYGPRVSSVTHALLEGQWVQIDPKQVEWCNESNVF